MPSATAASQSVPILETAQDTSQLSSLLIKQESEALEMEISENKVSI